jgi:hypothetical protein
MYLLFPANEFGYWSIQILFRVLLDSPVRSLAISKMTNVIYSCWVR